MTRPARFKPNQAHMVVLVLGAVHALSFAPGPLPGWTLPYVQVFSLAALFHRLFRRDTHLQAAG